VNLAEALAKAHELAAVSGTARLDIERLLCHVLEKPLSYLLTWPDQALTVAQLRAFEILMQRRMAGEPVAFLTGCCGFWTLELEVSPVTLIPRPDTERLVEVALERYPERDRQLQVADLGTGTGALALALAAERPRWQLYGTDRVSEAIELARRNARRNRLSNVIFLDGNWFDPLPHSRFDLLVSNPPYIDAADGHLFLGDVRFEPRSALVAADKGLADIRRIIRRAPDRLHPGGRLILEHGFTQGSAVRVLMRAARDLNDHERVTLGKKSSVSTAA
jgi:release factor glutamine methyltransferase